MTTAEGNITTLQSKTSNQTVLNSFTQFNGNGIKIMNGVSYSVVINTDGSSSFYGLTNIYNNLNINGTSANGIITTTTLNASSITANTSLSSGGTLSITGASTVNKLTMTTGDLNLTTGNILVNSIIGSITSPNIVSTSSLTSNGTLSVTNLSTLNSLTVATGNATVTTGNVIISAGNLSISGLTSNTINNSTTINGNLLVTAPVTLSNSLTTSSNIVVNGNGISSTALYCNNLSFVNSLGANSMYIGSGVTALPNIINVGSSTSTTILNGLVIFNGPTFTMQSYVNQLGY